MEAMFSGRHELKKIDGRVYVNRDPEIFKLILSHLRNDQVDLKINNSYKK